MSELYELLEELICTPSVTGFEDLARRLVSRKLQKLGLKVDTDLLGNVIGVHEGGEPKVMVAAHVDQIGIMVTHVDERGYIYFSARSHDPRVLYGEPVVFHTEKGPVYGVIGAKPIHLTKAEERDKVVKVEDMAIDVGASSREEVYSLGIREGSVATTLLFLRRLHGDRVLGVGLDDKAGVAAMIHAAKIAKDLGVKPTAFYVATTQEEVGARGAMVSAFNLKPDLAVVVEVCHASAYNVDEKLARGVKLGSGPAIGVGPNFHTKFTRLLMKVAEDHDIPYQLEAIQGPSGTDAWAIQVARGGVATALISIPLRYMHSPGEVISLGDLEHASKLIALLLEMLGEENWRDLLTPKL